MHYRSFAALLRGLTPTQRRGPFALVLVQDDLDVDATLAHYAAAGIPLRLALGPAQSAAAGATHSAPFDVHAPGAMACAASALMAAAPGAWVVPCWNGERLHWPHGDTRRLTHLFSFLQEERRDVLGGVVLDSYRPPGQGGWHVDAMGYAETGGAVTGGLRDRIGPPCPVAGRRLDRPLAVRARPGLRLLPDGRLSDPDLNALHGPWHHSPTAALVSPRVWAWHRARPDPAARGFPLHWTGSVALDGSAAQLWNMGLVAPGQWV